MLLSTRFEQYLPLYDARCRRKDRRYETIRRPLFPGYLFAKFPYERRHEVTSTAGVLRDGVLHFGPTPATLTDDEIATVRALESLGAVPAILQPGCRVRITDGALAGKIATLVSMDDKMHLLIEFETIGKWSSVSFAVDEWQIERVA